MCGRFVASRPISDIVDVFAVDDVEVPDELARPRWNIAPQAGVLAVTVRRPKPSPEPVGSGGDGGSTDGERPLGNGSEAEPHRRRLTSYRWGLVPSWAKDPGFGARAFNARAESLLDKSSFRAAVERRRCLIPADAFYEWEKAAGASSKAAGGRARRARQPWCYRSPDGGPLALAGLWEAWKAPPGGAEGAASPAPMGPAGALPGDDDPAVTGWHDDWLLSCTIITTPANETVEPVHNRMPLVLARDDWEAWLRPGPLDPDELALLLRTPPVGLLSTYEVSSEVNASSSDGPQLVEPLADAGGGTDAGGAEPGGRDSGGRDAGGGEPRLF